MTSKVQLSCRLRHRRVLSTEAENTLLDLLNSSYPTQPHSLIANYIISFANSLLRQHRSCQKNKVPHILVACHFVDKFRRTKDSTHESVGVFILHERRNRVSCRTMKLLGTRPP